MLADALLRTARTELGVLAMLVDAKDETASGSMSISDLRCVLSP